MILQKTYKVYWYHAFQDGPADAVKYDTREEAQKALDKQDEFLRRGTCIQSRMVEI